MLMRAMASINNNSNDNNTTINNAWPVFPNVNEFLC
jgi:hypothetical protein